jgi:hypothetical protein
VEEDYTITDVIKESNANLTDIINSGIEAGVELAQDDGIDFKMKCQISNGDSSEIENYKIRLMDQALTAGDSSIISKYQNL